MPILPSPASSRGVTATVLADPSLSTVQLERLAGTGRDQADEIVELTYRLAVDRGHAITGLEPGAARPASSGRTARMVASRGGSEAGVSEAVSRDAAGRDRNPKIVAAAGHGQGRPRGRRRSASGFPGRASSRSGRRRSRPQVSRREPRFGRRRAGLDPSHHGGLVLVGRDLDADQERERDEADRSDQVGHRAGQQDQRPLPPREQLRFDLLVAPDTEDSSGRARRSGRSRRTAPG